MWPYSQQPLRLALVGMSGSGKSYWTQRIAAADYPAISCDAQIEQRLAGTLRSGNYAGIHGVAAWMGWPDSPTYAQREAAYLAEEISTLDGVLSDLEKNPAQNLILDTTGSVIYVGNHLLHRLRKQMLVVYLAASPGEQELLIRRYLEDPKPVLWRGAFQPRKGEAPRDTVARCYPALIGARRQSYAALAHGAIPVAELRELSLHEEKGAEAAGRAFLEKVQKQLQSTSNSGRSERPQ